MKVKNPNMSSEIRVEVWSRKMSRCSRSHTEYHDRITQQNNHETWCMTITGHKATGYITTHWVHIHTYTKITRQSSCAQNNHKNLHVHEQHEQKCTYTVNKGVHKSRRVHRQVYTVTTRYAHIIVCTNKFTRVHRLYT